MHCHFNSHSLAKKQQGAVLLVGLLMLLLVTVIGTSSITSVTLEEQMVSNMQSATKSFQGAETVMAQCEEVIRTSGIADLDVGGAAGVLNYGATEASEGSNAWRVSDSFWASNGQPLQNSTTIVKSAANPDGLVAAPRCLIEYVGKVTPLDLSEQYKGPASAVKLIYLTTAYSYGSDTSTQTVIESLFAKQ